MLCIWRIFSFFFLESKAFQKHWVIFQIDLWGYYMIIQHFTDEQANRGPQKPTEVKPLHVSNFNRDGKRTGVCWPPTILLGPGPELLTLPHPRHPKAFSFTSYRQEILFSTQRGRTAGPGHTAGEWWSWIQTPSPRTLYYTRQPPHRGIRPKQAEAFPPNSVKSGFWLFQQHATWLHVASTAHGFLHQEPSLLPPVPPQPPDRGPGTDTPRAQQHALLPLC